MKVLRVNPTLPIPVIAHIGDAGYDLRSAIQTTLHFGEARLIPTGFIWEIPEGFCGFVKGRSGLAINHAIQVFHGVIDSGFRGELHVYIKNNNEKPFFMAVGDRIAQLVVLPVYVTGIQETDELSPTTRGTGGTGSTGVK